MEYRRGDVRDPAALREAFEAVDVVGHLAFLITGAAPADELRAVNVEGTLNAFPAAAAAGPRPVGFASPGAGHSFPPPHPGGGARERPGTPAAAAVSPQEE